MKKFLKKLFVMAGILMVVFGADEMKVSASTTATYVSGVENYNGHSYIVFEDVKTWLGAKEACEVLGGHLATITSEEELEFVNSLKGLRSRTNYWLGAWQPSEEEGWTWVTGETWSYTFWGDNQPDNSQMDTGVSEDYLQACYDWGMKWNDSAVEQDWTATVGYVCEWEYDFSDVDTVEDEMKKANDGDMPDSEYELLQAKIKKTTKTSLKLTWKKIKSADGYMIYGNKCGKTNKYEYICNITNPSKTSYTAKNLKSGTYYKYFVVAYKKIGTQKISITISKTIHATTTGKYGNAKSVKITKLGKSKKVTSKITLKVNKTAQIKGTSVRANKKKQIRQHRGLAYESSNPKVATVSKKGVIKAKTAGSCKIYVYAQNGVCKTIKVTVK